MVECPDTSTFPGYQPFIVDGKDLPKENKKVHLEFNVPDISPAVKLTVSNCNPDIKKIQIASPVAAPRKPAKREPKKTSEENSSIFI